MKINVESCISCKGSRRKVGVRHNFYFPLVLDKKEFFCFKEKNIFFDKTVSKSIILHFYTSPTITYLCKQCHALVL